MIETGRCKLFFMCIYKIQHVYDLLWNIDSYLTIFFQSAFHGKEHEKLMVVDIRPDGDRYFFIIIFVK